ncbi:MAG: helix-turn-helix domain-containing protein [Anaerolineae bacterium]|nr:helix-turn-helix domain-containing protein [Anaerolineae bacterium]
MSDGLGLWLRRTRETRQISLPDVEKALRIRRRYLQALEMGDYTALPGEIQARGFLRNYARYLNLPVEEALARYDAEIQGRPMQPRAHVGTAAEPKAPPVNRPSVFSPPPTEAEESASPRTRIPSFILQLLLVALVFFIVIAVGSFIWLQIASRDQKTNGAAAPVTAQTQPSTTETTPNAQSTSSTALDFVASADGLVYLRLVANEHAWIRVSSDANIVFEGMAAPGQTLETSAEEMLIVSTGNGGAFELYINGTGWGTLGGSGEVVRRAWNPVGEVPLEN